MIYRKKTKKIEIEFSTETFFDLDGETYIVSYIKF